MEVGQNEGISTGQKLRKAREQKQLALEDIARQTRIRKEFLEALEEERLDAFPGAVYARAFLREYSAFLGLDGEDLVASMFPESQPKSEGSPVASSFSRKSTPVPLVAVALLAAAVVVGAVLLRPALNVAPSSPQVEPAPQSPPGTCAPLDVESNATVSGVRLRIRAEAPCWMRIQSGGRVLYEGTLRTGDSVHFASREAIVLLAGNAGALRVRHNEGTEEVPGKYGEVITRVFEPANAD
ncbi:MAG: XRE family transcriptional regulator [Armatimonadota bacterium]|nr:MAG: XRE family transcriptional regulator [Armatimonadota bacterium]